MPVSGSVLAKGSVAFDSVLPFVVVVVVGSVVVVAADKLVLERDDVVSCIVLVIFLIVVEVFCFTVVDLVTRVLGRLSGLGISSPGSVFSG